MAGQKASQAGPASRQWHRDCIGFGTVNVQVTSIGRKYRCSGGRAWSWDVAAAVMILVIIMPVIIMMP